jgi:hypothetical protein
MVGDAELMAVGRVGHAARLPDQQYAVERAVAFDEAQQHYRIQRQVMLRSLQAVSSRKA